MRRSTLIPIVAVVIALVVLWFLFFATGGSEVVGEGDLGDVEVEGDAASVTEEEAAEDD